MAGKVVLREGEKTPEGVDFVDLLRSVWVTTGQSVSHRTRE